MGDILFLAHRAPWPPDRGDKIRSHNILRELTRHATVHIGCFGSNEGHMAGELYEACGGKVHLEAMPRSEISAGLMALRHGTAISIEAFSSILMRSWTKFVFDHHVIDSIFVFSGQMAQYVPSSFTGRVIIDFVDCDSAKFAAYGATGLPPMRWINAREGKLLCAFEAAAARRADASLLISTAEAELFADRTGASNVHVVGNGIDLDRFDPTGVEPVATDGRPLIVFTGQMDYRPNVEAVTAFVREAMLIILRRHPSARFAIVGRSPTAAVRALASDHVLVTGEVADVRPWLCAASVVVAPLAIARGVQNKVLEAMAMGRAVVASSAAAQGIDALDGRHLLVGATLTEQASLVCDLLSDPVRRGTLGREARKMVASDYRWDAKLAPLRDLMGWNEARLEAAS